MPNDEFLTEDELAVLNEDEETPPPAEVETSPPAEVETPPPTKVETPPPAEVETPPLAEVETPPPAEVETSPPAEVETSPPAEVETPKPQKSLDDHYAELKQARTNIRTELRKKLNEGDLSEDDYETERDKLDDDYDERKSHLDSIKVSQAQDTQRTERDWQATQAAFFKENQQLDNPIIQGAMAVSLRELYKNPSNIANKTQLELLQMAANQVSETMGLPASQSKDKKPPAKVPARLKADLPTTLSNVPAAAANIEVGEFDHLDTLSGIEREEATAKLTDSQRNRYLSA